MSFENSRSLYSVNENTTFESCVDSKTVAQDNWYLITKKSTNSYVFNPDTKEPYSKGVVWINKKLLKNGEVIAVVGVGMKLDGELKEIYERNAHKGARSIVVDNSGKVLIDYDLSKMGKNIYEKDLFNISSELMNGSAFSKSVQSYFKNPTNSMTLQSPLSKDEYLSISPIQGTSLHVATYYKNGELYSIDDMTNIGLFILIVIVVLSFGLNLIIKKLFMEPFDKLKESLSEKELLIENEIYGLNRTDEFKDMALAIEMMTKRLVQNVPVGLCLISAEGEFVYGNAYFLNQFKCSTRSQFIQEILNEPTRGFINLENREQLLQVFIDGDDKYFCEAQLAATDGTVFWAEIQLTKVYRDNFIQYEGILLNIDDKKNYAKNLYTKAMTDSLTGLYNRHYLSENIANEIEKSEKLSQPLSIIIFDLDRFKRVNDTYGHDIGDEILQLAAKVASQCVRKSDMVVRWGGEEFAILFTNTNLSEAYELAEKIRMKLESTEHSIVKNITASFGVAEHHFDESYSKWFKRADEALFKAKETGRNKVVKSQ